MKFKAFIISLLLVMIPILVSAEELVIINEVENNNFPSDATQIQAPSLVKGNAGSADEQAFVSISNFNENYFIHDIFKLRVKEEGGILAYLDPENNDTDLDLIIFDLQSGSVFVHGDRDEESNEIIYLDVKPGDYFIAVVYKSGLPTDYDIYVDFSIQPLALEEEDNHLIPNFLEPGVIALGDISKEEKAIKTVDVEGETLKIQDFYEIEVNELSNVSAKLESLIEGVDIGISIFDEDTGLLEVISDPEKEKVFSKRLLPGKYFLGVFSISGNGTYTLETDVTPVTFNDSSINEIEPNEDPVSVQSISIPQTIRGHVDDEDSFILPIDSEGDIKFQDIYSLNIDETQDIQIDLEFNGSGGENDLDLFLLNGNLEVVNESISRSDQSEQLVSELSSGIYYVAVGAFKGGASYTLSVQAIEKDDTLDSDSLKEEPLKVSVIGEKMAVIDKKTKKLKLSFNVVASSLENNVECRAEHNLDKRSKIRPQAFTLTPESLSNDFNLTISKRFLKSIKKINVESKVRVKVSCDNGLFAEEEVSIVGPSLN